MGLSRHHEPEPFLAPLTALKPVALIATQPETRPRPAEEVAQAARALSVANVAVIDSTVADAVRAALAQTGPDDLICLTGSFYTVGDVPPPLWTQLLAEYHASHHERNA